MDIDLVQIGKRIRQIRGAKNGADFGKVLGVSTNTVSCYESGQTWPKPQTLDKIIRLSGKTADWLLYGNENVADSVILEPQESFSVSLPVRTVAGAGSPCCIDQLEPIGYINIDKAYNGPNIQVVKIRGASMEPTIMDGGYVGVDVSSKEIISGQMYAVYIPHEGIVVKRIWLGPELVKIVSDNPNAPDHEIMTDRINWDSFIQGRVKWVLQAYFGE